MHFLPSEALQEESELLDTLFAGEKIENCLVTAIQFLVLLLIGVNATLSTKQFRRLPFFCPPTPMIDGPEEDRLKLRFPRTQNVAEAATCEHYMGAFLSSYPS